MSKLPNIVLIVMDTAGAKHMSLCGYPRSTTPHLERLAQQGTLYNRCFAPGSWTPPSHASLFTGLAPSEHGVDGANLLLGSNCLHLVTVLKQAGYGTYGISCNGLITPIFGICRDFDVFQNATSIDEHTWESKAASDPRVKELYHRLSQPIGPWAKLRLYFDHILRHRDLSVFPMMFRQGLNKVLGNHIKYRSAPYTRRSFNVTLDYIRQHLQAFPDKPFFSFINVIENHMFYNPPKNGRRFSRPADKQNIYTQSLYLDEFAELREKFLPTWINLYDDTMLYLDGLIGQFFDDLQAMGVMDNTIFIVTSDHGEHFGEKGFYAHLSSLYNELISVPLVIKFPSGYRAPGTDGRLVSLMDLFATVLEVTDNPFPCPQHSYSLLSAERRVSVPAMVLDGQALKLLVAKLLKQPEHWADTLPCHKYALVLDNDLKILQRHDGSLAAYQLDRDPGENADLFSDLPAAVQQELLGMLREDQKATGFQDGALARAQTGPEGPVPPSPWAILL